MDCARKEVPAETRTSTQEVKRQPEMPNRHVGLLFFIDTNRINARRRLPHINQLEEWHKSDVITIEMPEEAQEEAIAGGSVDRMAKANSYIYAIVTHTVRAEHAHKLEEIERILFSGGAQTPNQQNDVSIVFNAGYYGFILITDDGDSKSQPNGMLGNRGRLADLGIQVMRDSEAVEFARQRIRVRDRRARWVAEQTGQTLPDWVGQD